VRAGRVLLLLTLAQARSPEAAAQTPAPPAPASAPTPVYTAPRLRGYLQPRFQTVGDSAAFSLRRAVITVEGDVTPWAAYRVQVELRTIGAPAIPASSPLTLSATDLFIRLRHSGWGGTVGQFRVPFALESLLGSTILETTERSRIVNTAKRDIGVQADWSVPGRLLLQAAMVNGEGVNRGTNPDNRMAYFARAVVTPVKGLDLGGALEGYSDSTGANLQGMYRAARWTARAEYIREHNRATDVHTAGWYALGGYYALPQRLELVGRVERFEPSDKVATGQFTGYLMGAQYFMRGDDVKIVADYEWLRDQVVQVAGNRGVVQLQVRW
jgi:phosphate-selective porin OprO and OprP